MTTMGNGAGGVVDVVMPCVPSVTMHSCFGSDYIGLMPAGFEFPVYCRAEVVLPGLTVLGGSFPDDSETGNYLMVADQHGSYSKQHLIMHEVQVQRTADGTNERTGRLLTKAGSLPVHGSLFICAQEAQVSADVKKAGTSGLVDGMATDVQTRKQLTLGQILDNVENIGNDETPGLLESLRGFVLPMSLDSRGCRVIQRALELAGAQEQVTLAQELRGHVREALESPHANHVLQRAIELMRPSSVHFVLAELREWGRPSSLAKHRYGCRVLERLIEHFPLASLEAFLAEILEESRELSRHVYGNFVVQHVLEHGEQTHRRHIVDMLMRDLLGAATDQHACSVLDKALSYCSQEDQQRLAQRLLSEEGLLATMANFRGGFAATQRLFKVVGGKLLDEARSQIKHRASDIIRTKHGRALVATILPDHDVSQLSLTCPVRDRGSRGCPRFQLAMAF